MGKIEADGVPAHELQALAYHIMSKCQEQQAAFDSCMQQATKGSQCDAQYKSLMACTKDLLSQAKSQAGHEFKEFSKCLELTGKYSYCRAEKHEFTEKFPADE